MKWHRTDSLGHRFLDLVLTYRALLLSARSAVALDGDRAACCLRRAILHFCHAISILPVDLLMFIQVLGEVFDLSEKIC